MPAHSHAAPGPAAGSVLLFAVLALLPVHSRSQSPQEERERLRREKIESILRLQDLRTPFDARFGALLSDDDPVVRRRALLACGSLEDTSVLPLLVRALADPDSVTASVAAFAIGQTGTMLAEKSRETLAWDLVWKRLPETRAAGDLIEELGKFGTAAALEDLMVRVANAPPVKYPVPLMMSVARFAIRGITSADARLFLLRFVAPGVLPPWQAVYALEKTGDNAEARAQIESLRLLEHHPDPLLRMHLATLLGKLRDAGDGVLQRMAERDEDWRVRVNALRALGGFTWRGDAGVIATFRRAFFDANLHVAMAALESFATTGVDANDTTQEGAETLRQLAYIAENASGGFPWQLQAEAASTHSRLDGRIPRALLTRARDLRVKLRERLLLAAGESGDPDACGLLAAAAREEDPGVICAALEGFRAFVRLHRDEAVLIDSVFATATAALSRNDMAVVATAAGVLGDSLFRRSASVGPLLQALGRLRPPFDTEAMEDLIAVLGDLGDGRSAGLLIALLDCPDPAVALAAARALRKITGNDYSGRIARRPEPMTVDMDFATLRKLPPRVMVRLETSRGDVLMELDRENAPFTTMSIVKLSRQRGFYRGLTFHRVVPNFVVQGGDPRGDGWGGPGYALRSEFSAVRFLTGTVGIASAGKDTEGSQFFITHSPQPHLDGRYTVVGQVVSGMDVVDALQVDDRILDLVILP